MTTKPIPTWQFWRKDHPDDYEIIDLPENALSPRELRILRAAGVLRIAAWLHVGAFVVLIGAALAVGAGALSLDDVRRWTLFRFTGGNQQAFSVAVLMVLGNLSAVLVVMVGLLAREVWGLGALVALIVINGVLLALFGYTPAVLMILPALGALVIAARDARAYRVNPVMLKELRGRMRGMRAFIVLTVYLSLMSVFLGLLYISYTSLDSGSGAAAGAAGRLLFRGVVGVELLLIMFIAPAFTTGAITGERERQTYDLLRTTLLANPSFVVGKLESALSYIFLLLLAAIPLQSIAFLFGGVSQTELLVAFVILSVTAIALGTLGIYFSAVAPRTLGASVRTYGFALGVAFGAPLILGIVLSLLEYALRTSSAWTEALLVYGQNFLIILNPIIAALQSQTLLVEQQQLAFSSYTLRNGAQIPLVSPWIGFTILYLVISALLLVATVREMRKVRATV